MTKIRYHIIQLDVTEYEQVVEIRHRLPSNYGRCTGYAVRHVKGIGSDVDIRVLPRHADKSIPTKCTQGMVSPLSDSHLFEMRNTKR